VIVRRAQSLGCLDGCRVMHHLKHDHDQIAQSRVQLQALTRYLVPGRHQVQIHNATGRGVKTGLHHLPRLFIQMRAADLAAAAQIIDNDASASVDQAHHVRGQQVKGQFLLRARPFRNARHVAVRTTPSPDTPQ